MTNASVNESPQNIENELQLLEALALSPETTQADLAARVGVAVGTVNWYLKRWSKKGYIKVRRISRWSWSYLLTPEGIARKRQLAGEYVDASFSLYRRIRIEAKRLLTETANGSIRQIAIVGEGEIADICRLTCLEHGIEVIDNREQAENSRENPGENLRENPGVPALHVEGIQLTLQWPEGTSSGHEPENS